MVADVVGCALGGSQRDEGKVCKAMSGSLGKVETGSKLRALLIVLSCGDMTLCVARPGCP